MFSKLGALLDRIGSKRSPTKPTSKPRGRTRAFSVSGAPATPTRAPSTHVGVTSAPSTTLVFPLSPRPDDSPEIRSRALSPARRVRFSSGSSVCTTHSKVDYDRSPIVDAPPGATHEGTRSPSKLRKGRERPSYAQKVEAFPASFSSPNLLSASPEKRGVADSNRERRPSLLLQSASRSFVSMAIAEEGPHEDSLIPMTRCKAERGQIRPRPKPHTRPSVDSARAICGGVVGRGVHGPYASSDEDEIQEVARTPPRSHAPATPDHHGESFLSLDYSDDEDIDEDMHTNMFVNGRRASDRTQRVADALFFTLAADRAEADDHWEAYGAAQTEGKRDRARGQRETRALLAAFPEPPTTLPPPLGAGKHRAIAQWVKDSAAVSVAAVCDSAESSEVGHARGWSPSPPGWRHPASGSSTEYTTPEVTPPRVRPKRGHPPGPYDARAPPAKSCPSLVAAPARGKRGGEKLLPLVPYDALEQPFRYERHPYASPALRAERW